jgi:micrococcal nuclease
MLAAVGAMVLVTTAVQAVQYTWTDEYGNYNATDRIERIPPHYQSLLQNNQEHYVTPEGLGFDKDENGNVNFFDHSSPAKRRIKRNPPAPSDGSPAGSEVTPEQFNEVKKRYQEWGRETQPEIMDAKVKRIISGDTFELEDGQKVAYIGIEFPEEIKGNTRIHQEAVDYQARIMLGRRIKLLFGPQRMDDKGRLLAFVFVGTDMFMNADLVMNGYARVHTIPPNEEYKALFTRLQDFAQRSGLGIWDRGTLSVDLGAPSPTPPPVVPPYNQSTSGSQGAPGENKNPAP